MNNATKYTLIIKEKEKECGLKITKLKLKVHRGPLGQTT